MALIDWSCASKGVFSNGISMLSAYLIGFNLVVFERYPVRHCRISFNGRSRLWYLYIMGFCLFAIGTTGCHSVTADQFFSALVVGIVWSYSLYTWKIVLDRETLFHYEIWKKVYLECFTFAMVNLILDDYQLLL